MNIKLTQSQARFLKECLKLYDTQLLTSSQDWSNYDNLSEKLAGLSDTRSYDDFRKAMAKNEVRKVCIIGGGLIGCEFTNQRTPNIAKK